MKTVVDSSGWIEYFTDSANATRFEEIIRRQDTGIVPTVVLYEVFRWMLRNHGEPAASRAMLAMSRSGATVALTTSIAIEAARIGLAEGLAMADSIVLATARAHGATLWTQDADFQKIPGVEYIPRS